MRSPPRRAPAPAATAAHSSSLTTSARAPPVLRHRLAFNYRTLTENVEHEAIVRELIASVVVP